MSAAVAKLCPRCRTRFESALERCPHDDKPLVPDLSGQLVGGRYALRELLGVGGMDSSVWLAMQAPVDRPVAVKLLPPTTQQAAERFARGARIASKLNHPHITVVHDYGRTVDGHLFLVMELLEGNTLQAVVKRGPLPFERVLHITDQILKALDHAHRRQVVHRDIKPGNLFLTPRNDDPDFVKVLDFGIARFIDDPEGSADGEAHDEITTARQICGTPQYMSPEQVASGAVDQRSDLYSLGVVVYRMLTGRLPFVERETGALFMHHLHTPPPPLCEARPELRCPPELEALVMRALAKRPQDRYASAAEMRKALQQIQRRLGLLALSSEDSASLSEVGSAPELGAEDTRALPARPRGRRRWLVVWLALLLAGGLTAWIYSGLGENHARGSSPAGPPGIAPADRAPATAPGPASPPPVGDAEAPPVDGGGPDAGALDGGSPPDRPDAGAVVSPRQRRIAREPARPRPPARPPSAARSAEARPVAPQGIASAPGAPPGPAAPPRPAAPQVRLQLLDEGEARSFELRGAPAGAPAAPGTEAPRIELLE